MEHNINNNVNFDDISATNLLYKTFLNAGDSVLNLEKSKEQLDLLNENFGFKMRENTSSITDESNKINKNNNTKRYIKK